MKKYFITLILLILSCACAFAERPNWPTENNYPVQCNFGYKKVATPTITINDVTQVDLNNYLPAETLGFELRAASGSFIINHTDSIATGTSRVGRLVTAGETFVWNGLAGSFNGVILGTATSTVIVIDGAWGNYEP